MLQTKAWRSFPSKYGAVHKSVSESSDSVCIWTDQLPHASKKEQRIRFKSVRSSGRATIPDVISRKPYNRQSACEGSKWKTDMRIDESRRDIPVQIRMRINTEKNRKKAQIFSKEWNAPVTAWINATGKDTAWKIEVWEFWGSVSDRKEQNKNPTTKAERIWMI